jgi:hypothetical protein
MHLTLFENILWAFGTALKVLLCTLVVYRRLYKRFPFFSIYAGLLVAEVGVVWSVYRLWGFNSLFAWYTGWCAVGVVLLARGLVVGELCWTSLRNYPAIWSVVRKVLVFAAVIVLALSAISAYQQKALAAFILTLDRGTEISILVILIGLLGFGTLYDVPLGPVERNLALGIGIYSAFQVINDSFMNEWMNRYFHWWNSTRVVAFDVAIVMWALPLRKALPPAEHAPALLNEQVARRLLRQLLDRMREVTDELKRISKSIRK